MRIPENDADLGGSKTFFREPHYTFLHLKIKEIENSKHEEKEYEKDEIQRGKKRKYVLRRSLHPARWGALVWEGRSGNPLPATDI